MTALSQIPADSPAGGLRYAAFISYRHTEPDRRWAKWLHQTLETYRVPKRLAAEKNLPRRLGRCFRDEEELPASADLSREIDTALQQSKYLIVVCSPNTPKSRWVNQEVLRFRQLGRHDRILALLVEGEPKDSFPPALVEIRRTITDAAGQRREQVEEIEPLAADVRPTRSEGVGHLGRMARLRLIACVLGVKFDDLRQREQERRSRRLALLGGVLAVLLCIMGGLTFFAFNQRDAAQREAALAAQATDRALREAARANQATTRAVAGERRAEIQLADGLVAQGDALSLVNRWGEAKRDYWEAYGKFVKFGASSFRAETALAVAHAASPPELLTLAGHADEMMSVAISPDGRRALSGGQDQTLTLWDLATGTELKTLSSHASQEFTASHPNEYDVIYGIAFSPDRRTALTANEDRTLQLWDLDTGKPIRTFTGHSNYVSSVVFSADGATALSGSYDRTLRLWDVATGNLLRTFTGHAGAVLGIALSPDGKSAASASADLTINLWDIATGKVTQTFTGHAHEVTSVAFSPDGAALISGSFDKTVKLWDIATGNEVRTFAGHTGDVNAVAFTPDGHEILSASADGTVKAWNVETGKEIQTFTGHSASIHNLAISPDGGFAVSASSDRTLKLWSLHSGKEMRSLPGLNGYLHTAAFGPDGLTAITGSALPDEAASVLTLWDLPTARPLRIFPGHTRAVYAVAYSPDGRSILSASADKTLKLWDVSTGSEIRTLIGHADEIYSVAISPDSRFALSGSYDKTARLWDLCTGATLHTLTGHDGTVGSIAFTPDGHAALTGSGDNTLKLWDLATGKELRTFTGHTDSVLSVAITPDGRSALSASRDKTMKLWDLSTGTELRAFTGHTSPVTSVAISPDGRFALTGSDDNTAKLWDIATGAELRAFPPHAEHLTTVAFSPTGRAILCGDIEHTLIYWDFSRAPQYADFAKKVAAAQTVLQITPRDGAALATLGTWYAFRGMHSWAIEFLEKARAAGGVVDPLTLARCYVELSDAMPAHSTLPRAQCLSAALREYATALNAAKDESQRAYLRLCIAGVERTAAGEPGKR